VHTAWEQSRALAYTPRPRPSFVDQLEKVSRAGEQRWRDDAGRIYTYDGEHGGELEVYSKRGRHLAVADVMTGEWIKPAVRGWSIDV
jgi:hypothetical protein